MGKYCVYVRSQVIFRFDIEAESEEEAWDKYVDDQTLEGEVVDEDILEEWVEGGEIKPADDITE